MRYLIPAGLTLIILGLGQASPSYVDAELDRVIDGDTIDVKINEEEDRVRFLGMDTPETHVPEDPRDFGLEDTEENRDCLEKHAEASTEYVEENTGEELRLVLDRRSDERGFYDRKLVYIGPEDLNRQLVAKGYARVYPSEFSKRNEYYFWEMVAKKNGRGLWSCM